MPKKTTVKYWSVAELPEHPDLIPFRLTERRIRRAVQSGRLVGLRLTGGPLLFTDEQIADWIAASRTNIEA